ncbi:hypothetical protein DL762_004340 [Monosporascus cannonballus]|uniref:Carrier domain-containing protein n=1 Tax=Monosporascus cannonballus TaxID=155416 RepID=A0ABY0HC93_9PEZI|nr:hypothetical protein DL762_004340 [Monosporascus cannonballus]
MVSADKQEPIAIIGAACRLPGQVSNLGSLWDMISNAKTGHCKVPADRWDAELLHHPDPDRKGTMAVKHGYFLQQDISHFDAPFFSTTAKEAAAMDPMKRLLLEVSYECIENAGIPMESLANSQTGCYVGCMTNDYELLSAHDTQELGYSAATGLSEAMIANRVSWFFGLRGPSLTLDTACSSSLYALHLACQALKLGEAEQALVAGVNLILYPNCMEQFSGIHMLSPEGISHSFDDRANGYGRGEGIGCLIVKRLSDALRDGDTIRAVIRHTGVNADGKTPSITQPSSEAQADLIQRTYAAAGLPLTSTEYFESHGTGTPVGDPIELSAIASTIGAARAAEGLGPLYVGSVKPNVGHTEGCSGLAGVFKAILCLEKGMLVPTYDVQRVSPKLTLTEWNLTLPSWTMKWPSNGKRRISVNSFGFGGSNAHVILDDAYHYLKERDLVGNHNTTVYDDESSDSGISTGVSTPSTSEIDNHEAKQLFVFSSRDQAGLQRLAHVYRNDLESKAKEEDLQYLYNLSYTLVARRSHHDFRSFVVATSLAELSTQLSKPVPKIKRSSRRDKNLVFVFTGQGAQWPAMGIQLLSHPVFERSVRASQEYLETHGCEWNALEELRKTDDSKIGLPEYSQTLCTVLQVALVDLLRHWNIVPKATIGHSSGEIAAAYAASYISHSDAVKVAYVRGISSASVDKNGSMMAAGVSREEAQEYLAKVPAGSAVVACVNSPSSVTLSGDTESINILEELISTDNKFARKLKVKTAYHSPHMHGVAQGYLERLGKLDTVENPHGNTVMFSSLTGKLVTPGELTAEYWVANMCNTVEFAGAFSALLSSTSQPAAGGRAKGVQTRWGGFVEVGPHAALQGPVQQIIAAANNQSAKEVPYVAAVMRGKDANESALTAAGQLWASGVDVDLSAVNGLHSSSPVALRPKVLTDLPTYPWDHSRSFWHEAYATRAVRFPLAARTDLLGMPEDLQNPLEPRWKNYLRISENPWIEDHKITGTILYPAAGMLVMALEGALQLADPSKKVEGFRFRNISFARGLVVTSGDDFPVETRLSLLPAHKYLPNEFQFTVYTTTGTSWTKHCSGTVALEYLVEDKEIDGAAVNLAWNNQVAEYKDLSSDPEAESLDVDDFYIQLEAKGMEYGPLFRNVVSLTSVGSKKAVYGTVQIPDTQSVMPANFEYPHIIHPATMDSIFHLLLATVNDGRPTKEAAVPYHLEDMFVSAEQPQKAGTLFHGYSRLTSKARAGREVAGDLVVSDDAFSAPRIVARGFSLRQVTSGQDSTATATDELKGVNKCAVVEHTEDVDFIRTVDDIAKLSGGAACPLASWLTRLIHKKALPHVLLVVDHDQWQSSNLLPTAHNLVGQRPGFGKLTTLTTTSVVARKLQKLWTGSKPVDIKFWDVLNDEGLPTGNTVFDLVLVLGSQRIGERSAGVFAALKQALTGEGHLVVRTSGGWLREWAVKKAVKSLELPRLISIPSGSESFDYIAYKAEVHAVTEMPSEIYFLLPTPEFDRISALAGSVKALFAAANVPVRFTTLTPDNTRSLAGKHVISFLEIESPLIYFWSANDLAAFRILVSTAKHVLWITRGSLLESWAAGVEFSPAQGLLRVMRNEYPLSTLPYLDLSTAFDLTGPTSAQLVLDVWKASLAESAEMEYAELRGSIYIPRAVEYAALDNDLQLANGTAKPVRRPVRSSKKPLELSAVVGEGDYLWTEDESAAHVLEPNEVEVEVEFVGLGWLHLSSEASLDNDEEDGVALPKRAREAVGIVTRRGDNVTSVAPGQRVVVFNKAAAKTHVRQDEALVTAAPENLLPEEVAALPSALVAARYALELATLNRGQTVLIHDAAGVLGQAVLQVSQAVGAEAFALVETKAQKHTLVKKYGVPAARVFDSQNRCFVAAVQEATEGRGVDVVITSRPGPAVLPSLDVLGDFGYVFDFGAGGADAPSIILPPSKLNASLIRVDIDRLLRNKPHLAAKLFRDAFSGSVFPIYPTQVFSVADARQAVDALKTQKHAAAVLSIVTDAPVLTLPPPVDKLALDPNGTYVLAGGLGALGLNIATMMVEHGAKHLVFLSRSGGSKNEKDLEKFRSQGVLAEAFKCDVNDTANVWQVFSKLKSENRTVKGIVQCAMVLEDAIFDNMDHEKWTRAFTPKTRGSRHLLGQLTPEGNPFFILLSSITGIIGNTAQANYASGNTFEDALANHAARHKGIAATSIDVGLVADSSHFTATGGFGDLKDYLHRYQHGWVGLQCTLEELSVALQAVMRGKTADGCAVPPQFVLGLGDNIVRSENGSGSAYTRDRKFDLRVVSPVGDGAVQNGVGVEGLNVTEKLKQATSLAEAATAVELVFKTQVAAALDVEVDEVDGQRPLPELGVDSLKGVEMRNRVIKDMQSDISVFELLSATPLTDIAAKIASRSTLVKVEVSKAE